jgi:aryl carrier-like protein
MKKDTPELLQMKKWVETWKAAGLALDKIKTEELSQMSEEDFQNKISLIFDGLDVKLYKQRAAIVDSGFVEMQKIFASIRPS